MAKAYFTPYGVGLGHASRLVTIATRLNSYDRDVLLKFSSFGEATSYIEMNGFKCNSVSPVELVWSGEGGFSIKNSLGNVPSWFSNFLRQVNSEIGNLVAFSPNVIVSDSRLSSVVAGRLLRIPTIVILNQVKLLLSPRLRELKVTRIFEKINGEFMGGLWNMSEKVLIPDLPPPYTIAEHNLWDCNSIQKKVEYVGFTTASLDFPPERLDSIKESLGISNDKPLVFVHISGPSSTRPSLISKVLQAIRDSQADIQYVISEGRPNGKIQPAKLSNSVWYYEWCPIKDELFKISDIIVLRGGHTAISQAIQYGKPIVTIPIRNQGEQLGNSDKVAKMGIGIKLDPLQMDAADITNAILKVLNNKYFLENVQKLMKVANSLDGIENVLKVIRSYF
jgi:UDP-N-acetylglucosamine--N-acetylmuramyl-(pentapeptide) pyrophosphoryl-undecaprenol N-acetylglucosamine transferase